jgi:hypothetical protein
MRRTFWLGLIAAFVFAIPAQATSTVYYNDFTAAPTLGGGTSATFTSAGGATVSTLAPYSGTYGSIFRNNTTGLTELLLSNLPTHTAVDISFIMAFLDSWDSTNGSPSPDYLELYLDGALKAQYTSNNASGTVQFYGGGVVLHSGVQFDTNAFFSDTVVNMSPDSSLSYAHSASTLKIGFKAAGSGWQGGSDEAWAIDNLKVEVEEVVGIPEPQTYVSLLFGLGAFAAAALRQKFASNK